MSSRPPKYSKAPDDFTVPASSESKLWICKMCDVAFKQGKLPAQAKANNLDLEDIPPELSVPTDLTPVCILLLQLPSETNGSNEVEEKAML